MITIKNPTEIFDDQAQHAVTYTEIELLVAAVILITLAPHSATIFPWKEVLMDTFISKTRY